MMRSPWTLAARFVRNLKRWPWTRCAHCGLRFPFGYKPIHEIVCDEPKELHHACNTLRFTRARLESKTAALTEAYAIAGGLAAVLHSRLSPTPGVGPALASSERHRTRLSPMAARSSKVRAGSGGQ